MTAPPILAPPRSLRAIAAVAVVVLALPLAGLAIRTPWATVPELLGRGDVRDAARLSLVTSTAASLAVLVLGVPLAFTLARSDRWWVAPVRALVLLPMVLPPVVAGAALLFTLGRRGPVGDLVLAPLGVSLPFTTPAVIIAQAFVALPFLVVTVEAAVRDRDPGFEEVAATLGVVGWRAFVRVTLPLLRPAIIAGTVLAWARALGEFGATLTFAGNLRGRTRTMPLAVVDALRDDPDAALALSVVLVVASIAVLAALRARWMR